MHDPLMWDASSCFFRQDKHCIGSGVVIAKIEIVLCGGSCNRWRWIEMDDGAKKDIKSESVDMETSIRMTKSGSKHN